MEGDMTNQGESMLNPEDISRDDSGKVSSVVNNDSEDSLPVQGPLGIYPFPLLNMLMSMSNSGSDSENKVVVTEIHRDENGRVEAIEEIKT